MLLWDLFTYMKAIRKDETERWEGRGEREKEKLAFMCSLCKGPQQPEWGLCFAQEPRTPSVSPLEGQGPTHLIILCWSPRCITRVLCQKQRFIGYGIKGCNTIHFTPKLSLELFSLKRTDIVCSFRSIAANTKHTQKTSSLWVNFLFFCPPQRDVDYCSVIHILCYIEVYFSCTQFVEEFYHKVFWLTSYVSLQLLR